MSGIRECFGQVCGLVTKSCPAPVTPWTVAHQAPLSIGFSKQEYWSRLPFPTPGDLPNPGIKPRSPELQAISLLSELPENQLNQTKQHKNSASKSYKAKKCTRKNVYHMILKGQSKFSRNSPFSVANIFFTLNLVFFKVIKEKWDHKPISRYNHLIKSNFSRWQHWMIEQLPVYFLSQLSQLKEF